MAMERKWKRAWAKALRSGRYKQAQGSLQVGRAYCCLGVLCRVVGAKRNKDGLFAWKGDEASGDLPLALREELGMTRKQHDRFVNLNDVLGYDFDRIAKAVDRLPERKAKKGGTHART